ncbi:MAG: hypothetical protein ACREOI_01690 [bacterium]
MKRLLITSIGLWANHEARVLEIFGLALKMLKNEYLLPDQEDALNRKLLFCAHRANRVLSADNRGLNSPPFYEAQNQPDADDKTRAEREDKKPDFQWGFYDHQEINPEKSAKYYVLECKRLGSPPSPNWILNKNYILNGVCRFTKPEWGYAKSSRSGTMVGYIQSMQTDEILREVNNFVQQASLSTIALLEDNLQENGVSRFDQRLNRPEVLPTPFDLRHLWVDLRQHYWGTTKKHKSKRK